MRKENLGFLERKKFGILGLLVVALLLLSSYAQAATNSYTISDEEVYGKLKASFEVSYTQNSNGEYTILSIVIKSVTATFNPLLYSLYYDIEINVFDVVRGLTIDTGKVDGWLLFTNQLSLSNIVFNIASHDPSKRIYVDVYVMARGYPLVNIFGVIAPSPIPLPLDALASLAFETGSGGGGGGTIDKR